MAQPHSRCEVVVKYASKAILERSGTGNIGSRSARQPHNCTVFHFRSSSIFLFDHRPTRRSLDPWHMTTAKAFLPPQPLIPRPLYILHIQSPSSNFMASDFSFHLSDIFHMSGTVIMSLCSLSYINHDDSPRALAYHLRTCFSSFIISSPLSPPASCMYLRPL